MIDTPEKAARHRALTNLQMEVAHAVLALRAALTPFGTMDFAMAPTASLLAAGAIRYDADRALALLDDAASKIENELRGLEGLSSEVRP